MNLSDEQRALQETAADFLAAHTNARKEADADAELWSRIVELGWAAVQVPEGLDGLGLGPVELALPTRIHSPSRRADPTWLPADNRNKLPGFHHGAGESLRG